MKKILLSIITMTSFFVNSQIINDNVVAHYRFDGNGQNSYDFDQFGLSFAGDVSGSGYAGDGISGGCALFNATHALVNEGELAAYFASRSDRSITISFWMKTNEATTAFNTYFEAFGSVIVRGVPTSFVISRTSGTFDSATASNNDGVFLANNNIWNHMVYVYNAQNNTVKGYINNVVYIDIELVGTEQSVFQYNDKFVIGSGINNGTYNWAQKGYMGRIDEMFIFSRAISESEVASLYNLETVQNDCPESSVSLNSQDEVDDFVAQYPNCTEIFGDFEINGLSITDISGLENIINVDGELSIVSTSLVDLAGLNNIESFNSLTISNNALLTSIEDLGSEGIIANQINITNNPVLESLEGLSNVSNDYFGFIFLNDLPLVTSLEPLSNFTGTASFYINNLAIADLTGLEQITNSTYIILQNLPSLTSLEGLNQLSNFINLSNARIGDGLINEINDFSTGLIIDNTSISNLSPLSSLLSLANNNLSFYDNPNLTNLEGLSNLNPDSVSQLNIVGNESLSNCAISVICQIIDSENTSFVQIESNSDNCDSIEIIEEICSNLSSEVFASSNVQVFPNPFHDKIKIIQNNQSKSIQIDLYDISGKKILSQGHVNNEIEIIGLESLSTGIYFLKIQFSNGSFETIKLVK